MHDYSPPELRRWLQLALDAARWAAALAVMACAVTLALGALGVTPVCDFLYRHSPAFVQWLRPVRKTCVCDGFELSFVSAEVDGSEARVTLAIRDLEGGRLNPGARSWGGYGVQAAHGIDGTRQDAVYDTASGTLQIPVDFVRPDGGDIAGHKVTFYLCDLDSDREQYVGPLGLDLADADMNPRTQRDVELRSYGYSGSEDRCDTFLKSDGVLAEPFVDVKITGMGYIDGRLHVQALGSDPIVIGVQGYIYLYDGSDIPCCSDAEYDFDDEEGPGSYAEYIFDVAPEELDGYELYGEFEHYWSHYEGRWQVTFWL